eukprot:scaffold5547_cov163-Amphora_coffeaeformis.AAC.11
MKEDLVESRQEGTDKLNAILQIGLIHHVARQHDFADKHLFYRITPASDIKIALDHLEISETHQARVQNIALIQRYKQAGTVGLNISEILNSFYGCQEESGWDLVDL